MISIDITASPPIRFFPYGLDIKQTEVVRTLFEYKEQGVIISDFSAQNTVPVLLATHPLTTRWFCELKAPITILLDFHDTREDVLHLNPKILGQITRRKQQVIYLKLQVHSPVYYSTHNPLPGQIHILSCPLLLGGSRWHITNQTDFLGDRLFRNVFNSNPSPDYRYAWSWVGGITSKDRRSILPTLQKFTNRPRFFSVTRTGHADAQKATVPHIDYIAASRASKTCLSLNGFGPWCLKDGELLAQHCFILRQNHAILNLNPLTPRHGREWAVFQTPDECIAMIEHYFHANEERERIRDAGHALFRQVLFEGLWAKQYLRHFNAFMKELNKESLGQFAFG